MKKYLIIFVLLSVSLIGCKKTENEITCNLNTSVSQPPVAMDIVYTATQTGDGALSSLSYATNSGLVTVQNPSLPWTLTVSVISSANVSISAIGTTKNGSLKITFDGSSGGATIHGSDYCEQQTN